MKNVFRSTTPFQMAGLFSLLFFLAVGLPGAANAQQSSGHKERADAAPKPSVSDEINLQLNLDSVMREVNVALSKIDYAKINADVQKAMAQVDYNKINKEINASMKNIDWEKMKGDVSRSLDSAKMALNSINWDEMKAQVNQAQAEAQKAMTLQKLNTDSLKNQIKRSLADAQKSLQAAKVEWANYKALTKALERDGLLQTGKPYSIQLKDGNLYINGVRQSKAVTDKYSKYYSGKKNFMINNDGKGGEDL